MSDAIEEKGELGWLKVETSGGIFLVDKCPGRHLLRSVRSYLLEIIRRLAGAWEWSERKRI